METNLKYFIKYVSCDLAIKSGFLSNKKLSVILPRMILKEKN